MSRVTVPLIARPGSALSSYPCPVSRVTVPQRGSSIYGCSSYPCPMSRVTVHSTRSNQQRSSSYPCPMSRVTVQSTRSNNKRSSSYPCPMSRVTVPKPDRPPRPHRSYPCPMSRVTVPDASQDVADKDISRLCPPKIKPPPAHLPTLDLAFSNTAHAGTESCGHTSRWPRPPCSSVVSVPSNGQSPARRTPRAHP